MKPLFLAFWRKINPGRHSTKCNFQYDNHTNCHIELRFLKKYNQKIKQYEPLDVSFDDTNIINYDNHTVVINKKDFDLSKITDLIDSYDDIKQVLDWFKNREYDNSIIEVVPNNKIEINIDTEETKRTTILVNNKIYNDFNEFCNKHREFDKKDLLSMALKEYIQKYD